MGRGGLWWAVGPRQVAAGKGEAMTTTAKESVDRIPSTPRNDAVIAAAMENAADLGLTEDQEEFWSEVLGQVSDAVTR